MAVAPTNSLWKVSVVMCTFNGQAFVHDQIISILQQTYPVEELLVFDDASNDETVPIILELASRYACIKLTVNKTNIGFTKNFEQAIKSAAGDVVAISDQDDIWLKTKIERMIKAWKEGFPLIYCSSFVFSSEIPNQTHKPRFKQFEGTDARKIFLLNTISGHATIIRKEFIPKILPFTEGVMYDWWMAVVAAYNGGVQHCEEVLVYHRKHSNNITVDSMEDYNVDEQQFINKKLLIKHLKTFATAPNILDSHRALAIDFANLLKESLNVPFHKRLFLLIFKKRKLFFNYKRSLIPIISQLKHSYRKSITRFDKIDMSKPLIKKEY